MDKTILIFALCLLAACSYLSWPECLELMDPGEEVIEKEIEEKKHAAALGKEKYRT